MKNIEINRIRRLTSLFSAKGWRFDEENETYKRAFDQCCCIASELNEIEFELFCQLFGKFIKLSMSSYSPSLARALNKMDPNQLNTNYFNVVPLIAPKDQDEDKSGRMMTYPFCREIWTASSKFSNYRIKSFPSIDEMTRKKSNRSNETTIFIDDFIGSGQTAGEFLDVYEDRKCKNELAIFVCVAAMESGIKSLKERGYDTYYDILVKKGIGDCQELDDMKKTQAYKTMMEIENRLRIRDGYRFGYAQSEGLISMIRTPNNTFPIFWCASKKDRSPWPAPFPR